MPAACTHGDALRITVATVESPSLKSAGTIPGVAVLAAGGLNGPGAGYIRLEGSGTLLSYKAPGSSTFGSETQVTSDGDYLLEDGEDSDKWLRVRVRNTYLPDTDIDGKVLLADVYDNALAKDDVTAAEAASGNAESYSLNLHNESGAYLSQVKVWLKPKTSDYLEISDDNITFVSPTAEADALALSDIAPAGDLTLYCKRTIVAGEQARASMLNCLQFSFHGL